MNKEQYNNLNDNDKAIATECYIDGYKAAITLVESIAIRIGESNIDNAFETNKKSILSIMNKQLQTFQ